jgi:hypothetical protein
MRKTEISRAKPTPHLPYFLSEMATCTFSPPKNNSTLFFWSEVATCAFRPPKNNQQLGLPFPPLGQWCSFISALLYTLQRQARTLRHHCPPYPLGVNIKLLSQWEHLSFALYVQAKEGNRLHGHALNCGQHLSMFKPENTGSRAYRIVYSILNARARTCLAVGCSIRNPSQKKSHPIKGLKFCFHRFNKTLS